MAVAEDGTAATREAHAIEALDATGAGDAFRAAFAAALVTGGDTDECLASGCAAGALAASALGALPSMPTRAACLKLRGGGGRGRGGAECPMKFASRLNSMKDRSDLWDGADDVLGWVARQGMRSTLPSPLALAAHPPRTPPPSYHTGTVDGLDLVDFNHPQHLDAAGVSVAEAKAALDAAGLKAGAVCLRYPKEFGAGALTHPDPAVRARAVELTKQACERAASLGAKEVVIWSAFDGYVAMSLLRSCCCYYLYARALPCCTTTRRPLLLLLLLLLLLTN